MRVLLFNSSRNRVISDYPKCIDPPGCAQAMSNLINQRMDIRMGDGINLPEGVKCTTPLSGYISTPSSTCSTANPMAVSTGSDGSTNSGLWDGVPRWTLLPIPSSISVPLQQIPSTVIGQPSSCRIPAEGPNARPVLTDQHHGPPSPPDRHLVKVRYRRQEKDELIVDSVDIAIRGAQPLET